MNYFKHVFFNLFKSDATQLANVAKIILTAIFQTENNSNLKAIFQLIVKKIPYLSLKLLASMILNGLSLKNEENSIESKSFLIVYHLILLHKQKSSNSEKQSTRHSYDRAPPTPICIGQL